MRNRNDQHVPDPGAESGGGGGRDYERPPGAGTSGSPIKAVPLDISAGVRGKEACFWQKGVLHTPEDQSRKNKHGRPRGQALNISHLPDTGTHTPYIHHTCTCSPMPHTTCTCMHTKCIHACIHNTSHACRQLHTTRLHATHSVCITHIVYTHTQQHNRTPHTCTNTPPNTHLHTEKANRERGCSQQSLLQSLS